MEILPSCLCGSNYNPFSDSLFDMKYLITIWDEKNKPHSDQMEVGGEKGGLFGNLVDLEADISDGTIKVFKVERIE